MQNDWTSPSGSRWEPMVSPGAPMVGPASRRRPRHPVVAVLLAVLGHDGLRGLDHHGPRS